MRFNYRCVPNLPKLAWCAVLEKDHTDILVIHGPWLECHPTFFFEGVWDGDFAAGDFARSTACFGSGAKIVSEEQVIFSTPMHSAERIYAIKKDDRLWLSNSLTFLLCEAKEELNRKYPFYAADMDTSRLGIHDYVRTLPLQSGAEILMYLHRHLNIDKNLNIMETLQPKEEPFHHYAHYRSYLTATTRRLADNLRHRLRTIAYQPITTISSGYDSAAMSVLAKEMGCTEAITITDARRYEDDDDDSGASIAAHLHMQVTARSRLTYKTYANFPEAEFLISGGGGQEVVFLAFEPQLQQRILFTGCSVGRLLHANAKYNQFNQLKMGDASSSSWLEFRLRVGFLYLPLGFLGFQQHHSLIDITHSDAMKSYFVPGNFNKPIARRILEEAGLPRQLFGQSKKAVSADYYQEGLQHYLTAASYKNYQQYLHEHRDLSVLLLVFWYDLRCHAYFFVKRGNDFLNRCFKKCGLAWRLNWQLNEKYKYRLGNTGYLFHWAFDKIRDRYRQDVVLK